MTLREQIIEKVQKLPEQDLDKLLQIIEGFAEETSKPSLMEQLRKIKISASPDFSTTAEIYPTVKRDEK